MSGGGSNGRITNGTGTDVGFASVMSGDGHDNIHTGSFSQLDGWDAKTLSTVARIRRFMANPEMTLFMSAQTANCLAVKGMTICTRFRGQSLMARPVMTESC